MQTIKIYNIPHTYWIFSTCCVYWTQMTMTVQITLKTYCFVMSSHKCVCMCVCVRHERERNQETEREKEREIQKTTAFPNNPSANYNDSTIKWMKS